MFATRPEIFIHKTCNKLPSSVKRVVIGVKMPPHPTVDAERKEELILAKQIRGCTVSILPRVSYFYFKINLYCPFFGYVGASNFYELSFLKRLLSTTYGISLYKP